jgi:hypothetical protein
MKVSFYAAALIGLVGLNQNAQAVNLPVQHFDVSMEEYEQAFSQIESLLAGEGEGKTMADADCEETVGGVTLRLSTPECEQKPEVSFEQQMLLALQELSGKSMDLYDALKLQFAKNQKLAAGKRMNISGSVVIKPKIDGEPVDYSAAIVPLPPTLPKAPVKSTEPAKTAAPAPAPAAAGAGPVTTKNATPPNTSAPPTPPK